MAYKFFESYGISVTQTKSVPLVERDGGKKDRETAFGALCWIWGLEGPWFENTVVLGDN